ncbi:MAG: DMT family transporter [Rhizobiales bacterium]|nr:DMT family transporter [Hyphomicrobiales bacterium]
MDRRGLTTGYAMALAGAALFSSKAIFVKLAYVENSDALLILAWRMIFSLPFFAAVGIAVLVRDRRQGKPRPRGSTLFRALAVGVVGYYIAMILDFEGLVYVTASLERLALFTYPMFLLFIAAAFFGSPLKPADFVAVGVSYAGLALVFLADFGGGGENLTLGIALVLASALAFAVYQLLATRLIGELGSVLFTSVALSGAAIASLVHFFLLPLLTIALAVAVLGERFALVDAFGTALVVGGVGYHTWRDLKR